MQADKQLEVPRWPNPESVEFLHEVVRNRSLGTTGRRVALLVMGGTTLGVGGLVTAVTGAWPVLPFAGLELLVLWLGFRWIAGHDGDYERIVVTGGELVHEVRIRENIRQRRWNCHWSTLLCRTRGCRVELHVRSHGREAVIGQMMMDEDRTWLAESLRGLVRVQKITS